jgi:hypothetical protein
VNERRAFPLPRSLPLILAAAALAGCLFEAPDVDLDGPTIIASTLYRVRSVELPVMPELIVEFSEPLDPATIHSGSVVVVAWDELGSCALTPICVKGSCERGSCQTSPLSATKLRAIDRGTFEGGEALRYELSEGSAGPDTRLRIQPRRPLASHRRHSLIIGAAVRDRSGARLADEHGRTSGWQRDFVTAGRGSSGPEPRLVAPVPGQAGVPTNVASVDVELWPPIEALDPSATLFLEPQHEVAPHIELIDPLPCPGWVPGTCLRWRPAQALEPGVRYRPAGGTLVDGHGQPARLPAAVHETWFLVGNGPDLTPPNPSTVAQMRGRCLAVWVEVGEPVEAVLHAGAGEARASLNGAGWIGLAITGEHEIDELLEWSLELRDLADNRATVVGELPAGLGFHPALPQVQLTEVLASPLGPNPHAEFVEVLAGPHGADLTGVHLADVYLSEVREAWQAGKVLGDPLPAVVLEPDEVAIVVALGYTTHVGDDPQPPASTRLLVVDASLGNHGLKNVGEPITLWMHTEFGPTAISTYGNWIDTGKTAHKGRSVVVGHDGCDLPDRWRSHPFGQSTPGTLP